MTPSKDPPHNLPSAHEPHPVTSPSLAEPQILRERISQQLAELAVEEKGLVDRIHRKRLELNQLWNASLLVHRLPNELLVQVFTHFPDVAWSQPRDPSWSAHRDSPPDRTGWHRFMLVCRHWRAVFVLTPTFWRKIDLGRHGNWTSLCFTRSTTASLDVSIGRNILCLPEVLHHHAHRFKTLRLDAQHNPQLETALALLFRAPMPLLEDLHLGVLQPEAKPDIQVTSLRFPRLQALALRGTKTPQDTSLFAHLRELSLYLCTFDFSFDAFLDMLAASLHLEELKLRATLSYPSDEWVYDDPVPRRPPISLPRLRKFTVTEHGVFRTSCFLAHLCLQPSVILLVEADYATEPFGTQAVSSISEMLPPNRAAALPILATATEVDMTIWFDEYEISCAPVPRTVPTGRSLSPRTVFALSSDDNPDWTTFMAHGLADLVECFRQAPVTRLTVSGKHDYGTADTWEGVFRAFPHLEFLMVSGAYDSRVTDAFRGLHAASTRTTACADESPAVACRSLKQVDVEGLSLVETYAAMEECFRYRGDKGIILQVLNFSLYHTEGATSRQARRTFVKDLSKLECIQVLCVESDSEYESEGEA